MRNNTAKNVAFQATLGLLITIFGGCSRSTKTREANVVELRVFDRITTVRAAEYSRWLVTMFNQRHRGKIHITWSATEDETFKPKINIVLRSRTAPDIFFTWEGGW